MTKQYEVFDSFLHELKEPVELIGEKRPVIMVDIPYDEDFPIKIGDSLIDAEGNSYKIIFFEWAHVCCFSPMRSIGIVLDRPLIGKIISLC